MKMREPSGVSGRRFSSDDELRECLENSAREILGIEAEDVTSASPGRRTKAAAEAVTRSNRFKAETDIGVRDEFQ
jgi:hypothetical protein